MNRLIKAELTVGLLACFALGWGIVQDSFALIDDNLLFAYGRIILQLFAVFVISVVLMSLLKWVDVFDLKTNAILTLTVLVTIRLLSGFGT